MSALLSGARADLLSDAVAGPLSAAPEIIFCTRSRYNDGHWYANIGFYCDDPCKKAYAGNGQPDKGVLYRYNVRTQEKTVLLDAKGGSVRDAFVDYDGHTLLLSYRPAGTDYYHLYEMQADGSALRQLTDGPWDDYEPCRLPDGDIIFVTTRCKRWVSCWYTQVGTLYRCKPDGTGMTALSANIEHDNTPAVMPDGRILYMRWEYIDRSQVEYHHLWTMNPDGTGVNVFYGNMHSYILMIDAQPVPGTQEVIASFSPGHGANEHAGYATLVSPLEGPDHLPSARRLSEKGRIRDPQPLSKDLFLMARDKQVLLMARDGKEQAIYTDPAETVHEPRVLRPRPREPVIPSRVSPASADGQFVLVDVYAGRNMDGVKRGDIKKLLVLEPLPKPVNFSGGMDLTSFSGSFNLERVLGTVPVEADGSASFIAPAGRPLFFVSLDANDLSVKRMQSFANLMPGETFTCIGCHEERASAAGADRREGALLALQRPPSVIQPFAGLPDVLDFQRDVQPILDRHCVTCHNPQKRAGNVNLVAAQAPRFSSAYVSLLLHGLVADGRNGLGNQPPRTIGSAASPLLSRLSGGHKNVKASPSEWRTVWLWIEAAAPFGGSYAALRNTEEQNYYGHAGNKLFGECRDVFKRRCFECHKNTAERNVSGFPFNWGLRRDKERKLAGHPTGSHERIVLPNDPARLYDAALLANYTQPDCSALLLAPLAKEAGGYGRCGKAVFTDKSDPDYKKLLASIESGKALYAARPPWGAPGWKPNPQYVREMKRFGLLPETFDLAKEPLDPFAMDQAYWRSLWPQPAALATTP
jgi:mono/diheme cytochrome c family protein